MLDSVPWMVGGGAEHSTNVARSLAFAAFGGNEGIVGAADLEVRELAVPGTSVRVFPGTGAILNRAVGIFEEMYVGRCVATENVAIAPTNSSGGRSDLIVMRVENPYLAGEPWQQPADYKTGPYIFIRVIPNVPPGTTSAAQLGLGYSALALARIDIPASTGTIQQSMIVDLRRMSQPKVARTFNMAAPAAAPSTLTSVNFVNWPTEGNLSVDVPSWATRCRVRVFLAGVGYGAAGDNNSAGWNVVGNLRVLLGLDTYSQGVFYNVSNSGGADRTVLMAGAPDLPVKASLRGTTTTLKVEGKKNSGTTSLFTDDKSMISVEVEFFNAAETNV